MHLDDYVYGFFWRKLYPTKINDQFTEHYYIHDGVNINSPTEVNPHTLGQYTGLKDSKGVEIYEGDIIKSEIKSLSESEIYSVSYAGGEFHCDDFSPLYVHVGDSNDDDAIHCTVIGNIYDNPELMNYADS